MRDTEIEVEDVFYAYKRTKEKLNNLQYQLRMLEVERVTTVTNKNGVKKEKRDTSFKFADKVHQRESIQAEIYYTETAVACFEHMINTIGEHGNWSGRYLRQRYLDKMSVNKIATANGVAYSKVKRVLAETERLFLSLEPMRYFL